MKVTGKRSEKILVEELSKIMRDLSYYSSRIEELLARMRRGKKRTYDDIFGGGDLLIEAIPATLAKIDGKISSLMVLSPDNKAIENYQKKLGKWQADHVITTTTKHPIAKKEKHTLRIRPLDAALVLQKIMIDFGGLKPSYLGAPQSETLQ